MTANNGHLNDYCHNIVTRSFPTFQIKALPLRQKHSQLFEHL